MIKRLSVPIPGQKEKMPAVIQACPFGSRSIGNPVGCWFSEARRIVPLSCSYFQILSCKANIRRLAFSGVRIIRLFTSGEEIIPISARTGANLDRLIQELTRTVNLNTLNTSDVIVSNVRHYEALRNARTAIERVNEGLESGLSGEFISQDIRECLHYLGEITGEITTDEVLGNIFKNFCIGK